MSRALLATQGDVDARHPALSRRERERGQSTGRHLKTDSKPADRFRIVPLDASMFVNPAGLVRWLGVVFEVFEDSSGEVALEAADGFFAGFAF